MEKRSEKEINKNNPPVNNSIYQTYGERWYTADDDPVALLRAESKAKTPWVLSQIEHYFPNVNATQVLDVGCGGGFLSNAMAQHGFQVTGVDLSEESIKVAVLYDQTKSVRYLAADAYQLPFSNHSFDAVTAMDFLEHVDDPQRVILEISRVLKPGGVFIFHTFNRNLLAHLVIIKFVEWFVKNTPDHMHVINLFIKPAELRNYCIGASMQVKAMIGIKPVFSSIGFKSLWSGVVPKTLRFELTSNLLLSYMGLAIKN